MVAPHGVKPRIYWLQINKLTRNPFVFTVEDAFNYFIGTNLDVLVINNLILKKTDQKVVLKNNYKNKYELD